MPSVDIPTDTTWIELLEWRFEGQRWEDHGLGLEDLEELVALRDVLLGIAKELWRRDNPERERLPGRFDQKAGLKFFGALREGCTGVPISYRVRGLSENWLKGMAPTPEPADIESKLVASAELLEETLRAAHAEDPLPSNFPRAVLPGFEPLGKSLREGESARLILPKHKPVPYTARVRERLLSAQEREWQDDVNAVGEVTAVSLKGRATIIVNAEPVDIEFTPEQERRVTGALYDHNQLRLHVVGVGTFEPPMGRLKRIHAIRSLLTEPGSGQDTAPDQPLLSTALEKALADVSEADWKTLPPDFSRNLDEYLYGNSPKTAGR